MDAITSIRIESELWKQAKIYCIENNTTLRALITKLLKKEFGEIYEE